MTIAVSRSRILFYALLALLALALLLAVVVAVDTGPAPDTRPNPIRFDGSFDPGTRSTTWDRAVSCSLRQSYRLPAE